MNHRRRKRTSIGCALLVALTAGAVSATSAQAEPLDPALCAPNQSFTLNITNAFLPLSPVGRQWVLVGEDRGESLGFQLTVLAATRTFNFGRGVKVTTRVVEEREWADANGNGVLDSGEALIEVSLNYFAQAPDGTVCYFGETVDIYENGVVVSHSGSWLATDPGSAPGIFMPAVPTVNMTFQQEFAPGVAEDQAKIVGSGPVTVAAGTFSDTIRVQELNPIDADKGDKVYARDVGLIMDGTLGLVRCAPVACQ
jgi:hypothetical protein